LKRKSSPWSNLSIHPHRFVGSEFRLRITQRASRDGWKRGFRWRKLPSSSWRPAFGVLGRQRLMRHICVTCGTQYPRSNEPPLTVPFAKMNDSTSGQRNRNGSRSMGCRERIATFSFNKEKLWGIHTQPNFAIGKRALLQTDSSGVLWDCLSLIDASTVELVNTLGGLSHQKDRRESACRARQLCTNCKVVQLRSQDHATLRASGMTPPALSVVFVRR
jgi:hypothetical protein